MKGKAVNKMYTVSFVILYDYIYMHTGFPLLFRLLLLFLFPMKTLEVHHRADMKDSALM